MFGSQVVDVGAVFEITLFAKVIDHFLADAVDVHHAAPHEVLDSAFDLRCASVFVGTYAGRFPLDAYERSAAGGAVGDKFHRCRSGFALRRVNSGYFRYDFAPFFNVEHIMLMYVESAYYVGIVERRAFYNRARK